MYGKVTASVIHAIRSMTARAQIYVRMASVCLARVDRGVEGLDDEVRLDVYKSRLLASVSCLVYNGVGRACYVYCLIITLLSLLIKAVNF